MPVTPEQINKAIDIAREYGASRLLLFGSALTDPDNANDLDLGVDGIKGLKFFEYGGALDFALKIPVDIVDLSSNTRFINHIKKTGKFIYDTTRNTS
ncbi:MAG: uncharacterized protein QG635_1011 [Bacteroidota bacterium]|nr:uncharacterized protein [Bacteroidota bacterium]